MFTIGITGGTGSGKTTALNVLKGLGALVLDCDAIYHELLLNDDRLKDELNKRFADVLVDGVIDRKRLGEIVFRDPQALRDLNVITHQFVGLEIKSRIDKWQEQGGTVVAIDAIALIESGRSETCDVVVGVTAPKEIRIKRIMARDNITEEEAKMRINAQQPDIFYRANCGYMIEGNFDTAEEFQEACTKFFKYILTKYHDGGKM